MKYASLILPVVLLASCATTSDPSPKEIAAEAEGLSASNQLEIDFPTSGQITRVLAVAEEEVRLDAGRDEGVQPGDWFAVFHYRELCGVWRVSSCGDMRSDCFEHREVRYRPRPGDIAVGAKLHWSFTEPGDPQAESPPWGDPAPAEMPFGRHPMGPWETEADKSAMRVEYETVRFIGTLAGKTLQGRRKIQPVWGSTQGLNDEYALVGAECLVAIEAEDGQFFAQVLAYSDDEKREFQNLPEGTRVMVYGPGLELHGSHSGLRPPGSYGDWRWSSDQVGRVSHVEFAIPAYQKLYPLGARVEVWRDELFIGYARHDWTSVGQHFILDQPAFHGARIKGGEVVASVLFDPDDAVTVALHGSFDYPEAPMSRTEIQAGLSEIGCIVHDRVGPDTDLVILGSSLLQDEHYRKARNDLRFKTMRDDDAAKYLK